MSEAYLERIAGELADLAMADEGRTGDEKIVAEIAEIVGASSQTLQEAYLTAVRVRRAEKRARKLLADRASDMIVKSQRLLTSKAAGEAARADRLEAEREEEELQDLLASVDDQSNKAAQAAGVIVPPSPHAAPDAGAQQSVRPSKPDRR